MLQGDRERRLNELRDHVRSWLALWGMPAFDENLTIEWSSRLHRSLGRAFPRRRLVRLSPHLLTARPDVMLEAVCHEVAHVVVPRLYRGPRRPHGPEWARLIRAAGFPTRIKLPFVDEAPPRATAGARALSPHRYPSTRLYIHVCPVCHARRVARRRITRWRCAACVAAGLDGRLTVEVMKARSS
jgi:predicted SprT family Zn-dependent metalloprotease